jgi:hypothetical protein
MTAAKRDCELAAGLYAPGRAVAGTTDDAGPIRGILETGLMRRVARHHDGATGQSRQTALNTG